MELGRAAVRFDARRRRRRLLSVRKAGGKQDDYLTIKMEKVLLTSVAPSGTEADDGIEQVALNFEKVSYDYKPQKDDGTLDAASSLVWNARSLM